MWQVKNGDHWYDYIPADVGPIWISANSDPNSIYFSPTAFRVVARAGSVGNHCEEYSNIVSLTIDWDQQPSATSGLVSSSPIDPCMHGSYTLYYTGNEPEAIWQYFDGQSWRPYAYVTSEPLLINDFEKSSTSWRVVILMEDCFATSNEVDIEFHHRMNPFIEASCNTLTAYADGNQASLSFLWSPGGQTT